jgi:uncharacterized heparinase superfamily protein
MTLNRVYLYARTLRTLRARQVAGRIRRQITRRLGSPVRYDRLVPPAWSGCAWQPVATLCAPTAPAMPPDGARRGTFTFLHVARQLGFPPTWQVTGVSPLWTYNLHYLDLLWTLEFDDAVALALDWIDHNPAAGRGPGWDPYPLSLRLMNLCWVFWHRFRDRAEQDPVLCDRLWSAIFRQAAWLRRHTEIHLLGNHYLENGAALATVGACFGSPAAAMLRSGLAILDEQLPEQMLPDGGHFERAPMYHVRATWLLASLYNTGLPALCDRVRGPLERAMTALGMLCHPDGDIALLNDSALGIYTPPAALMETGRVLLDIPFSLPVGCFALSDSGYYGWRNGRTALICDAGPVGPDYIPGHAHADMLSFEMAAWGRRVIVDSGVCEYVPGEMRDYCRSTRAHNTVEIGGQDQCECWAAHRVARRGRIRDLSWEPRADGFTLAAAHTGYRRLPQRVRHRRRFHWASETHVLSIEDAIRSNGPVPIVSRIHLHPDAEVACLDARTVRATFEEGAMDIAFSGPGSILIEQAWYCPAFGVRQEQPCVAWKTAGSRIDITCTIRLCREEEH